MQAVTVLPDGEVPPLPRVLMDGYASIDPRTARPWDVAFLARKVWHSSQIHVMLTFCVVELVARGAAL
jgi:molybdopterin biosynthesis enzyme